MAYKALYRTYRPTTFEEVAGQQHIVKTLKNAISKNKIAHAYLFAGPRGTGKTTMAKLFAKALNCNEGVGHQCNQCENCLSINEGTHPDVIELDAASNNGVDEIRDLIEKVKYGTILGKTKVYIIDEVHMLSTGAFNALLKTLEEPPAHVVFILATTEPQKILPTILSRCQRYDFTSLSEEEIKNRIKVVLEQEKISYNEEAVNLISDLADGGMRDALSILDQVLAYSGDKLDVSDILDIFSLESKEEKMNLILSIANHDISDVLNRLNKYIDKGTDIKRLTNDLLLILKDGLIYSKTNRSDFLETLDKEEAKTIANNINAQSILKMIEILMNALKDYKNITAINPLFEVTLLKLTAIEKSETKEDKKAEEKPQEKPVEIKQTKVESLIDKPAAVVEEKVEKTLVLPEKTIEEKPQTDDLLLKEDRTIASIIYLKESLKDDKYQINDDLMINVMVTSKKELKADIVDKWVNIKKFAVHPIHGKYASLIADCHPLVVGPHILILETQLNKMAQNINQVDAQEGLQNLILNAFDKKLFIYALPRAESVRLQQKYMSLVSIDKLPKAKDIKLEFIGE